MAKNSGNNGPTLKKTFFCTGCRYLKDNGLILNSKCMHDEILKKGVSSISLLVGDIKQSKITPSFCPFLKAKLRKEKLDEIKNIE